MPLLYLIRREAVQTTALYRSVSGQSKVAQRKFQATVFGVIVVSDGESDIDRIAGQERRLLHTLGHVPAEGVERDLSSKISSQFSVRSCQWIACIAFG